MKRKWENSKVMLIGGFVTLLVLFYWMWLFYTTQLATETNTYNCHVTITNIKVHFASHRGSDKLYIKTKNRYYMLDTGWRNKNKSNELAESIISNVKNCTITVWEHFPKNLFDIRENGVQVYQIVELKNDTDIYWSITSHNDFQRSERIAGIIAGVFMSIFTVIYDFFVISSKNMRV